jgi:hypothetical protein
MIDFNHEYSMLSNRLGIPQTPVYHVSGIRLQKPDIIHPVEPSPFFILKITTISTPSP